MKFLFDLFPVILFFIAFKLFGSMGLMLVFIVLQSIWMSRHIQETPSE